MEKMAISEFKATCLAVIERVRRSGVGIVVTKHGVPVAQVLPAAAELTEGSDFGCMAGTAEELGDIVEPLDLSDWEVLR
jgi:prevent-host-death family protein